MRAQRALTCCVQRATQRRLSWRADALRMNPTSQYSVEQHNDGARSKRSMRNADTRVDVTRSPICQELISINCSLGPGIKGELLPQEIGIRGPQNPL